MHLICLQSNKYRSEILTSNAVANAQRKKRQPMLKLSYLLELLPSVANAQRDGDVAERSERPAEKEKTTQSRVVFSFGADNGI